MIYIKLHDTENGKLLALCDKSLIGSIIEEGDIFIDLKNYADFYIGDLINTNELQKKISLQDIYSANIVGEESVSAAIDSKIIKKSGVKRLKSGLMYAHAYKIIQ